MYWWSYLPRVVYQRRYYFHSHNDILFRWMDQCALPIRRQGMYTGNAVLKWQWKVVYWYSMADKRFFSWRTKGKNVPYYSWEPIYTLTHSESRSVSTALSVRLKSSSSIVWSGCCWVPDRGDCPHVSTRAWDLAATEKPRRPKVLSRLRATVWWCRLAEHIIVGWQCLRLGRPTLTVYTSPQCVECYNRP